MKKILWIALCAFLTTSAFAGSKHLKNREPVEENQPVISESQDIGPFKPMLLQDK